jgi:hypothetical protein
MDNQCNRVLDILKARMEMAAYYGLTSLQATQLKPPIWKGYCKHIGKHAGGHGCASHCGCVDRVTRCVKVKQ